jgi:1-acyl-sn-glycerol-3-phosphate acyltransferase
MSPDNPLKISQSLLTATGTQMFVYHEDRIPGRDCSVIVVSNHRGFMDTLLLMAALKHPIRMACHHYMGRVPMMRLAIEQIGGFPLKAPEHRQQAFFEQATQLLEQRQWVGLFPEGAGPMVHLTKPNEMRKFHRGFVHLALRTSIQNLAILPVAIGSFEETVLKTTLPLPLLRLVDPSEPLFAKAGWHPLVLHHRVAVSIGNPYWITPKDRKRYQGKDARKVVSEITKTCQDEISNLLYQTLY